MRVLKVKVDVHDIRVLHDVQVFDDGRSSSVLAMIHHLRQVDPEYLFTELCSHSRVASLDHVLTYLNVENSMDEASVLELKHDLSPLLQ